MYKTITKPFKLATFYEGRPEDGGGYVHKTGVLRVLKQMQRPDFSVIVVCDDKKSLEAVQGIGLTGVIQRRGVFSRVFGALSSADSVKRRFGRSVGPRISPVENLLRRLDVDLVLFPGPDLRALQLYSFPYIFSIWDLAHLEHPEFPEVSLYGEFERREYVYRQAARKAVAVLADSTAARTVISDVYGIPESHIFAVPFQITPALSGFKPNPDQAAAIRKQYGLTDPYIFYPAQFWPHKNHHYILSALRVMLDEHGWAPQAVFCGSDKGALNSVLRMAESLHVAQLVHYCGFVPEETMPYLYAGALALVMPTYFGPSNIPPIEAIELGVPVFYSDFPAFRETMGDSVRYVDLHDPGSLATSLSELGMHAHGDNCNCARERTERRECANELYREVLEGIIYRFRAKVQRF